LNHKTRGEIASFEASDPNRREWIPRDVATYIGMEIAMEKAISIA